jgi:hypothetical protein
LVERWISRRKRAIWLEAHRWCDGAAAQSAILQPRDVNVAIRPLLDRLDEDVSRHRGASRRQLLEGLDMPVLKQLPLASYIYAEWKKCRAGFDYHIAIDRHYYSVKWSCF